MLAPDTREFLNLSKMLSKKESEAYQKISPLLEGFTVCEVRHILSKIEDDLQLATYKACRTYQTP